MAHPHNSLVVQAGSFTGTALGTLAARTALALNTVFNALTATFLGKRWRGTALIIGVDESDGPFSLLIAPGNATVAEVTSAMIENNTGGPDDVTQSLTEDTSFVVVRNAVVDMVPVGDAAPTKWFAKWDMRLGSKGIPFPEGSGFSVYIFNRDTQALETGSSIQGMFEVWGVWLRD